MGRPIVYCSDCGTNLREADFQQGKASLFQDQPYCSKCRPVQPKPPGGGAKITSNRIPIGRTPKPFPAARPKARSPLPLVLALVGGALLLGFLLWAALKPAAPPPPAPKEPPRKVQEPSPRIPLDFVQGQKVLDAPAPAPTASPPLDPFLAQIREVLAARNLPRRREEVESMLKRAEALAGPRKSEVDALRAEYRRKLLELDGLVGHWPLDGSAADAGPLRLHGTEVGGPAWTDGRILGGLRLAGREDHAELPNSAELNRVQEGDYSMALWFRPDGLPVGEGKDNRACMGLLMKPGLHHGLHLSGGGRISFSCWLEPERNVFADGPPAKVGAWAHYAGVLHRSEGRLRLYVDGLLAKESGFPPGAAERDYGRARWRIGCANPGSPSYSWPAAGTIDDVRIYGRALAADEIRALAER